MREHLYELIRDAGIPRSAGQLAELTGESVKSLQRDLDELQSEGRIAVTRRGAYAIPESIGLLAARIAFQRNGTPLARPLNGTAAMQVKVEGSLRCMPDDLVLVRPMGDGCVVSRVLKRARDRIAAYVRVDRKGPRGASRRGAVPSKPSVTAVPCDPRIPYDVALSGDLSGLSGDGIALLRIEEYPEKGRPIRASVLRVLGDSGEMATLMKAVAEEHGFATIPSTAVLTEAQSIPDAVSSADMAGREDLRQLLTFTIDGATAKDFDDAVSIEKSASGWRLGVHIADVSHYVRQGTAVDADARARGTSLYLPGCTVPMLPEALCNHLCSLMPDEDRLALSLFMEIRDGSVADHRLVKSVIRSHARLTYEAVNRMLEHGDCDFAPEIRDALTEMLALSRLLRNRRQSHGAMDLEIDEPQFVLDEQGEPVDILCQPRGEAERIIEDFMLAANETVAALAQNTECPFVYRVHEPPDADRLYALGRFLGELGLPVRIGPEPHPGELCAILNRTRDHPARDIVRQSILRALKRARYSDQPLGHYALSLRDYCHFTSPIRRYPDLTVHRMLKLLIDGECEHAQCFAGEMAGIAAECSAREDASVQAERQADAILYAAWMSHRIGAVFDGVVASVTGWGLYVRLPNGAEGLVHISHLDDYYAFDQPRSRLVASATGAVIKPGDRVRVRVERVNVPLGEIDFELLPPENDAPGTPGTAHFA